MPKLSEILGEAHSQISQELQAKYKDIDLVDSKQYVAKDKFDTLNEQLKTANTTINDLKKINKDNEELQTKVTDYETKVKDYETKVKDYETKVKDYEKKIQDMQFNYALEGALKGANVRNTKAVKAFLNLENVKLDGENILGLKEQIEVLQKSDSYLFVEEQQNKFSGIKPTYPCTREKY